MQLASFLGEHFVVAVASCMSLNYVLFLSEWLLLLALVLHWEAQPEATSDVCLLRKWLDLPEQQQQHPKRELLSFYQRSRTSLYSILESQTPPMISLAFLLPLAQVSYSPVDSLSQNSQANTWGPIMGFAVLSGVSSCVFFIFLILILSCSHVGNSWTPMIHSSIEVFLSLKHSNLSIFFLLMMLLPLAVEVTVTIAPEFLSIVSSSELQY
ncbi:uncharacterized protein G2W53_035875 [Senna tora]|uniref:Uncharacterized protein n=1 Tax=Senna tora TaxID=362788 RepID=A0A834SWG0_9FABA|nr:uncharacterized protein G2W53_035875 [Senna tora]